jgi:hypothetical protein
MRMRLFIAIGLAWIIPLGAAAHESARQAVVSTYTTTLHAGAQAVAMATCPAGMEVLSGGYKLVDSTLTMRALVVVENRPVPEARQWQVSLLYDPAPGEIQQGELTLETSVLCQPAPRQPPAPLSHREL